MRKDSWVLLSFLLFLNSARSDETEKGNSLVETSDLFRRSKALFTLWKKGVEQGKALENKYLLSLLKRSASLDSFQRAIDFKDTNLPYFKKSSILPYFDHQNTLNRREEVSMREDGVLPYFRRDVGMLPYFVRGLDEELPYFKRNIDWLPYFRRAVNDLPYFRRASDKLPYFRREIEELPYFRREIDELPYFKKDTMELPYFKKDNEKKSSELERKVSSMLKKQVTESNDSTEKQNAASSSSEKIVVKSALYAPTPPWFTNRWGKEVVNRDPKNDSNSILLFNLRKKLKDWLKNRENSTVAHRK